MNCKEYLKNSYDELVNGGYVHIDKVNWIAMDSYGDVLVFTNKPEFISVTPDDGGVARSLWLVPDLDDVDDWYDCVDTIEDPSQYNAEECIYYCKGENIGIGEAKRYDINEDLNIIVSRHGQGYLIAIYSEHTDKLIATKCISEVDYKGD